MVVKGEEECGGDGGCGGGRLEGVRDKGNRAGLG